VRGELRVILYNPASDILERLDMIFVVPAGGGPADAARPAVVAGVRRGPNTALLTLEGVGDRDTAAGFKGSRLLVPRTALPPPANDEFYVDDLYGIEVRNGDARLGAISGSREQGGIEVVSVALDSQPGGSLEEIEIPLAERYVVRLSVDEGLLVVRDIDDLPRHGARRGRG